MQDRLKLEISFSSYLLDNEAYCLLVTRNDEIFENLKEK